MFKLEFLQTKRLIFHFVIFLLGHTIIYKWSCRMKRDMLRKMWCRCVMPFFLLMRCLILCTMSAKKIRRHQENEVKCCSILWTVGQKNFFCPTPIGYRIPNRFCWLVGRRLVVLLQSWRTTSGQGNIQAAGKRTKTAGKNHECHEM